MAECLHGELMTPFLIEINVSLKHTGVPRCDFFSHISLISHNLTLLFHFKSQKNLKIYNIRRTII